MLALLLVIGAFGLQSVVGQNETPCSPEWGATPPKAQEAATLYTELYRQQNYTAALPYLKTLLQLAPGARQNAYLHGITIYKDMLAKATSPQLKAAYIDTIMMLHDGRIRCFGQGYGIKAYDLYTLTPADIMGNINAFDLAFAKETKETDDLLLLPYMITVEKAFIKGYMDTAALINRYIKVVNIVESNAYPNGGIPRKYEEALSKITLRLTSQLLTCPAITPFLRATHDSLPLQIADVEKLFKLLYRLGCKAEPLFIELAGKLVVEKPNEELYGILYTRAYEDGKYDEALKYATKALELATENPNKAKYHLEIAKIQQGKGDFVNARASALFSAQLQPRGAPYVLIGDMYAASGKLCSNGIGWESQVILWAAMDMYEKAKSLDPSVVGVANKKLNECKQLIPTSGECYFRNFKEGDKFEVGCWINETTTVRCVVE